MNDDLHRHLTLEVERRRVENHVRLSIELALLAVTSMRFAIEQPEIRGHRCAARSHLRAALAVLEEAGGS